MSDFKVRLTPVGRVCHPKLFTPEKSDKGKDTWKVMLVFPPDADLTIFEQDVQEALALAWPKNPPKNLKLPIKNIEQYTYAHEHAPGSRYINFATQLRPPSILDENKQTIIDPEAVYSGCYGWVSCKVYAYNNNNNRGVSFGLEHFQKLADGPRLGVRSAADDFPDEVPAGIPEHVPDLNDPMFD